MSADKERYATIGTWERVFQEEGFAIDHLTIRRRLESIEAIAKTGRTEIGRLVRSGFFAEADVRRACADLMQVFPQADHNNIIHLEGEEYRTVAGWSGVLKLTGSEKVKSRFRKAGVSGIKGRMTQGNIRLFFSERDFRRCCSDLVQGLPQADERGFIEKDGISYIPRRILSEHLGISESIIERAVQANQIAAIEGFSRQSRVVQFYPEPKIREACKDYLGALPLANEEECLEINGEEYRLPTHWATELGVHVSTVIRRLKKAGVSSARARMRSGHISNFYSSSVVRAALKDLLDVPIFENADKVLEIGGQTYATARFIARRHGLSDGYVAQLLRESDVKGVYIRLKMGPKTLVYPVKETEILFTDYPDEIPRANEEGYFDRKGERYWTVTAWAMRQGLDSSCSSIYRRMFGRASAVQGRVLQGKLVNFYATSDFLRICSDLLEDYPCADSDSCLIIDTREYRTVGRWAKIFGIAEPVILRRLQKSGVKTVKARVKMGNIRDFYPESVVRELCSDFLEYPQADENGFLHISGFIYVTQSSLAKLLGISPMTVGKRIKQNLVESVKGRGKSGRIVDFYPQAKVQELCADLIAKKSKKR